LNIFDYDLIVTECGLSGLVTTDFLKNYIAYIKDDNFTKAGIFILFALAVFTIAGCKEKMITQQGEKKYHGL
jgi:hypothetical protein